MAYILNIRNPATGQFEGIDAIIGPQGPTGPEGPRGYSGLFPTNVIPYAANVTVPANMMNTIATLSGAISITLGEGVDGYDNEWAFEITQGETAQTVTLPNVSWLLGIAPAFAANTTTQVRLFRKGSTLMGEWI